MISESIGNRRDHRGRGVVGGSRTGAVGIGGRSRSRWNRKVSPRVVHLRGRGPIVSVSSSRPSIRACGSPAHGLPTSFTAGIRLPPPVLKRPGSDNDSSGRSAPDGPGTVGQHGPPMRAATFVALAITSAIRVHAWCLIFSKRAVELPNRKYAAQPRRNRFTSSTITSTGISSRDRRVSSLIRSRACLIALSAGQRAGT